MNMKEISERVRDHLVKQKARSVNSANMCQYRGMGGTMCAVGCLISDEVIAARLNGYESMCADASAVVRAVEKSLDTVLDERVVTMLLRWQQYHDNSVEDHFPQSVTRDNAASYKTWIATGDADHSPEAVHQMFMEGKYL